MFSRRGVLRRRRRTMPRVCVTGVLPVAFGFFARNLDTTWAEGQFLSALSNTHFVSRGGHEHTLCSTGAGGILQCGVAPRSTQGRLRELWGFCPGRGRATTYARCVGATSAAAGIIFLSEFGLRPGWFGSAAPCALALHSSLRGVGIIRVGLRTATHCAA